MAGFREFLTGEVLTAANVDDFLMKQTVQKYADAAARDAALGTAVAGGNALREGMVSYLDDENEVQYFDGTAWDAISQPIAGIGSNVVSTVLTSTFSTSSTSYVAITGLTAAITPSSATSKILVIAQISGSGAHFLSQLTGGNAGTYIGDAAGSRVRAATFLNGPSTAANTTTIVFLDSPATAAEVTYGVEIRRGAITSETLVVNGNQDTADSTNRGRMASSLTVIEVAP